MDRELLNLTRDAIEASPLLSEFAGVDLISVDAAARYTGMCRQTITSLRNFPLVIVKKGKRNSYKVSKSGLAKWICNGGI